MQAVDAYFEMWNEEDAVKRAEHIERAWEDDGHYVDPLLEARGRPGLSEMVETVQGLYPGHRFRPTSGVDLHHDLIRFGWELVAPDGTVAAAGLDVGVVSVGGKLRRIAGFIGPLPEEASA